MNLTQAQFEEIDAVLANYKAVPDAALQIIANKVIEIIERSKPTKPIPKPCPPPVLNDVVISVSSMYPTGYILPEGWYAEFGQIEVMAKKGFTHYLCTTCVDKAVDLDELHKHICPSRSYRICFKKWEG